MNGEDAGDPMAESQDTPPETIQPEEPEQGKVGSLGNPQDANASPAEKPILINASMFAPTEPKETRIDFERDMPYAPALTLGIMAILVAIFIWELVVGALQSQAAIIQAGALHRSSVLGGEVWRLVTAIFLHGSPDHLIGNCLCLYILGIGCQHAFGAPHTLRIFLGAGLVGSLLSVALQPGPSVGASGAIFGLMGALIFFLYRYQIYFFLRDKRIGFVLLAWSIYELIIGILTPYVDNFGHLGGLIGGATLAKFLKPKLLVQHKLLPGYESDVPWYGQG